MCFSYFHFPFNTYLNYFHFHDCHVHFMSLVELSHIASVPRACEIIDLEFCQFLSFFFLWRNTDLGLFIVFFLFYTLTFLDCGCHLVIKCIKRLKLAHVEALPSSLIVGDWRVLCCSSETLLPAVNNFHVSGSGSIPSQHRLPGF